MFRSALFAKQFALHWLENAFEDFSALRRFRIGYPHTGNVEAPLGVPLCVFIPNPQRRLGNEAQAAPLKIRTQLEDFSHRA